MSSASPVVEKEGGEDVDDDSDAEAVQHDVTYTVGNTVEVEWVMYPHGEPIVEWCSGTVQGIVEGKLQVLYDLGGLCDGNGTPWALVDVSKSRVRIVSACT
jgi:hypothetical protein